MRRSLAPWTIILCLPAGAAEAARADEMNEAVARAVLERVQHDPALSNDPSALDDLARAAETFPPGDTRDHARMLVGLAWLERLHRPDAALAELRTVANDPEADPITARFAEERVVEALLELDRLDAAVAETRARARQVDPGLAKRVDRLVRQRRVRRAAVAHLGLFFSLVALALGRAAAARRLAARQALRNFAPMATLFAIYVSVGGGVLAASYESASAAPFLWLGAASIPLALMARAWGAVGSRWWVAHGVRAAVCAGAALAAAFMALDALRSSYLGRLGF